MRTLIAITFLFLLSCNAETQNQNAPDQADGDDIIESTELNENNISDDTFSFPQLQSSDGCLEENFNKGPSLCEWGLAAYDIVLLEITETSLIVSPAVTTKGMVVEDCRGWSEPGFRMEGLVQKSINGLTGKITVDVGLAQHDNWSASPSLKLNEDGSIKWYNGRGIQVGDVIGLTLHKHPTEETLGVLGEHFFDINQKNTIRFGELESECGNIQPKNAGGLTFAKLKEEIKKCTFTEEVDARKLSKAKTWEDPIYSNLGLCGDN